jgi:putative iron-dependent peroxidase
MCAGRPALLRSAGFRDLGGHLTCVVGFASEVWDRLFGNPRPAELHPFREFHAENRHAIATPGDVLFHVRAERMDLCFELASLIMTALGDAVAVADEVQGFQYFDNRDLLGFVDGTENPEGQAADDAVLIGGEDPAFAGGSYVVLQKYLHDLAAWNALPTEMQERIIGRTKLANTDLDPAVKPSSAHNVLTIIVENGVAVKIVRCNMPFGQPGQGEFGTYFIGYSKSPRTIEQMLENMFVGRPPGNYDRLLDFSRAVTGNLFFVPAASLLDSLAAGPEAAPQAAPQPPADVDATPLSPARRGSLAIGSLKGNPQ